MWNPFGGKPVCPVDQEMRQWIDERFRWLEEQLGRDVPRNARVILPTPEFFPDRYEDKPEDAQVMLARVAGYMGVDPDRFELTIYDKAAVPRAGPGHWQESSAAGIYSSNGGVDAQGRPRPLIGIDASALQDPLRLVATLAHEIGHEILIGQGRVAPDQPDQEPLTDLLTVFMGLGIFNSNATISDKAWSSGGMHGWQTRRLGYLDQRSFGYALARFAWVRREAMPSWMKHVRPDVRVALRQGLRFLKT
jgi:hypothetical protein